MVVHGIMVNNSYADFVTQSGPLLKFTFKGYGWPHHHRIPLTTDLNSILMEL